MCPRSSHAMWPFMGVYLHSLRQVDAGDVRTRRTPVIWITGKSRRPLFEPHAGMKMALWGLPSCISMEITDFPVKPEQMQSKLVVPLLCTLQMWGDWQGSPPAWSQQVTEGLKEGCQAWRVLPRFPHLTSSWLYSKWKNIAAIVVRACSQILVYGQAGRGMDWPST